MAPSPTIAHQQQAFNVGTVATCFSSRDVAGHRRHPLESTLFQQPFHADSNGFTPQQEFFISYAETWCSNATHHCLSMMAQSNPHSAAQARANGVVSNMPEFQKTFGCKKGQPMVRENGCRVW